MEYTYELIEALEVYYQDNIEQFLSILKELSGSINNLTAKSKFELKIEYVCQENSLCKQCFRPLDSKRLFEDRGEYFGFPAMETINEMSCSECEEY